MLLGGDGKAVEAALGLGGAKCTQCTVTKKQKDDPKFAENYWYPKNRSRDQNLELYQSLKKKRNGSIDTTVLSDERLNMSQKPMGDFLDWSEALPITHLPIRSQYDWNRLAIFMKARHLFPNKIPIMDGSGFGTEKQQKRIKKGLATAKKWVQKTAKDGPLKMFLMTPDPHGAGGSRLESSINKVPEGVYFILSKTKLCFTK